MPTSLVRPRVFISSTVHDFKDLRGAIKFWLEEIGYEVNASEFNDFRKAFDANSFEACLRAIGESDYFILLIGGRAGIWYNESARVTVTMQEYRRAYELAQTGALKIIVFVRGPVWEARDDRNELRKFIKEKYADEHGLTDIDVEEIANHKTRVLIDADVIFEFLKEVGRVEEMRAAIARGEEFPPANWIHPFDTFHELVGALRMAFVRVEDLRKAALICNLKTELINNLKYLVYRFQNGRLSSPASWVAPARERYIGGWDAISTYSGDDLKRIPIFCSFRKAGRWIATRLIDEAIISGAFLEYRTDTNSYFAGEFQKALIDLRGYIDRLRTYEDNLTPERILELKQLFPSTLDDGAEIPVPNPDLLDVMSLYDIHYNIIQISTALIRGFDTGRVVLPALFPGTPLDEFAPLLAQETPSDSDITNWIQALG